MFGNLLIEVFEIIQIRFKWNLGFPIYKEEANAYFTEFWEFNGKEPMYYLMWSWSSVRIITFLWISDHTDGPWNQFRQNNTPSQK